jgi:hypothetical protein
MNLLLVTSSLRGQDCMAALRKAFGDQVQGAGTIKVAVSRLRQKEFTAVVLDQNLIDSDPAALETLVRHFGTATPVYINLALHSLERVLREVQLALNAAKPSARWRCRRRRRCCATTLETP